MRAEVKETDVRGDIRFRNDEKVGQECYVSVLFWCCVRVSVE